MKFILKLKGAYRMKNLKNRIAAAAAVFVFVSVLFCSAVFIIDHASHKCQGSGCEICAELAQCSNNLRTYFIPGYSAVCTAAAVFTVYTAVSAAKGADTANTLISMKVELLN